MRRVLPYRTSDDHIAGVVITFVDFTALKHADAEMQNARTEAVSANATKTRFLATASHDLRQPLQSLNLLNAALIKISDDVNAQRMLNLQGESLQGMSRLLNSLLDISKLETGAVDVAVEDMPLRPLIQHLVDEFEPQAAAQQLQLGFAIIAGCDGDDLSIRSDPVLLSQLLQNLIANAIRYTPRGCVQIDCTLAGNQVEIAVRDSGIGIAANQLVSIADHRRHKRGGRGL